MKIYIILEWDHGKLVTPEIAFKTEKEAEDYTKDLHFHFYKEIELKGGEPNGRNQKHR